jgi:hypothetical protein
MTVLDTNVVGIVLPTIARDLGVSFADIECVISTYMRDAGTRKEEPREFREQQYQSVRVLGIHADRAMTDTVLVDVRRVRVGKIQSTPNKT